MPSQSGFRQTSRHPAKLIGLRDGAFSKWRAAAAAFSTAPPIGGGSARSPGNVRRGRGASRPRGLNLLRERFEPPPVNISDCAKRMASPVASFPVESDFRSI